MRKYAALFLITACLIAWHFHTASLTPSDSSLIVTAQASEDTSEPTLEFSDKQTQTSQQATRSPAAVRPESAREDMSLKDMTLTLSEFAETARPLRDLIELLSRTHQEPSVTRDANPYTGEMVIVRTQNPLPGTRYFHAQYFANEENQLMVQHMSFEFRPGPSAMMQARAAVQAQFPQLSSPVASGEDFVKWTLGNGYNVWIKKMHLPELSEDPFNAYTAGDEGTVRVAIESDVHGEDD